MKTIQKKRKKAVNRKYTAPKSLSGMDNHFGETFGKPFDDLGIAIAKKFVIPLD